MSGKSLILFTLGLFMSLSVAAQIQNPSFEGPWGAGKIPEGWSACHVLSTPDTQPSVTFVDTTPSDGSSYISLVSRGNLGPNANTTEDIQAPMTTVPAGEQAVYSVDLAMSAEFGHYVGFSDFISYANPVILTIWIGTSVCSKEELVWESPPIAHTSWETYFFTIAPQNINATNILLQVEYAQSPPYFGNILIDNIKLCTIEEANPVTAYEICRGDEVTIDLGIPNVDYEWSDGSREHVRTFTTGGTYSVVTSNSCASRSYTFTIDERSCECSLDAPNFFSPNGDTFNETFSFTSDLEAARFQLHIYNRWGSEVFSTHDIQYVWDGKSTSGEVSDGTYFYVAQIMCVHGNAILEREARGFVEVVR